MAQQKRRPVNAGNGANAMQNDEDAVVKREGSGNRSSDNREEAVMIAHVNGEQQVNLVSDDGSNPNRYKASYDDASTSSKEVSSHFDELPSNVLNFWSHLRGLAFIDPVCYDYELEANEVFATELFGEPLVLFRNKEGKVICIQDVCPHRSTPLSIGFVKEGELFCRYHGWRFGGDHGECTSIPSLPKGRVPSSVKTQGHPTKEAQKFIWVFPGDQDLAETVELPTPMQEEVDNDPSQPVIYQVWDSDYSYLQIMENLMDPCHLQFTHEGQQQKNIGPVDKIIEGAFDYKLADWRTDSSLKKWGISAHVQTTATRVPLDYKLIAEPPTLQRAIILPGKNMFLTINHYVVPLRPNKTRIFLKLARNFITFIPPTVFAKSNDDIMQQDITVLTSQNARLRQGANRWNFPVKADGASMHYRRFWEGSVANFPNIWFKEFTRTNACKDAFQKGCIRGCDTDIEDLPAFIWPHQDFLADEQKGIENMWNSPAAQKWPSYSRKKERSSRSAYALGYQHINPIYGNPSLGCYYVLLFVVVALLTNAVIASIVFWIDYADRMS